MLAHSFPVLSCCDTGGCDQLAGGWRGLITFPLLTFVMPAVAADATSAIGLVLAYPTAVWRTRHEIATIPRRLIWWLLVPSVLGGLVGALLLVYTNERNFTFLVP